MHYKYYESSQNDMEKGTSIMEVVIYVGLLSIMLTSSVMILFQVTMRDEQRMHTVFSIREQEFVLEKIRNEVVRASQIILPEEEVTGDRLVLKDEEGGDVEIYSEEGRIMIRRGEEGVALPLNDKLLLIERMEVIRDHDALILTIGADTEEIVTIISLTE